MSEWPSFPLVDLVQEGQISYGVVQPGNDTEGGVPIVRVKDVRNRIVDISSPMRVASEIADKHSRTKLIGGELLLSLVGTVGESAVAPECLAGWNVARAIAVIRPTKVSSRWLQLCFESAPIRAEILGVLNTTVQSTLNLADLKRLRIPVPPSEIRSGIEEVLGGLDDKIAANTKLAATADELCTSLVTRASMSGTFCRLSEVASVKSGYSFKSKDWQETGVPVVKIGNIKPGVVDLDGCSFVSDAVALDAADYRLQDKDILIAMTGYVGEVARHRGQARVLLNQRVGRFAITDHNRLSADYLYYFLRLAHVKNAFIAKGQGSAQQNIGAGDILSIMIPLPDSDGLRSLTAVLEALDNQIGSLIRERTCLTATRDALLPQFMSGKLRVSDAEKVLENAGV